MAADGSEKGSEPKDTSAAATATAAATAAPVDPRERYLQLLVSSLVLLRDAVETQDIRYTLRMLRRFKQLRLQQQQHPQQLLQVCSLLFWGQQQLMQQLQDRDSSSSSSSYAHLSHLPPNTVPFWRRLQETLELIVKERQGTEGDMEMDGVRALNPKP